jgi:hypothetical protein
MTPNTTEVWAKESAAATEDGHTQTEKSVLVSA